MDISKIEKMFVTASNLQERADRLVKSILKEYGVDYYEDITDEFARELCERIYTLSGGMEDFREFVINNGIY